MHGRDHAQDGMDPIALPPAQFFQYRCSADATIADVTSTKVFYDTQSVNTVDTADFTLSYSSGGGGTNPVVGIQTLIAQTSIWIVGLRVEWTIASHAASYSMSIQLNPVANDGAGNTALTYYYEEAGGRTGSVTMDVTTYVYLLNPTVGQSISLVSTVRQKSGGNQTLAHTSNAINGTNLWGVRVA